MPGFSYALNESSVPFVALSILTGTVTSLQNSLYIIQYQQTAVVSQILKQQCYLAVCILREVNALLVREKLDAGFKNTLQRWCIFQFTPKDILKFIYNLLC